MKNESTYLLGGAVAVLRQQPLGKLKSEELKEASGKPLTFVNIKVKRYRINN